MEDLENFGEFVRDRDRRYATMCARPSCLPKEVVELSMAQDGCNALNADFGIEICDIRPNPDDPPDCFASLNGQQIGIEITELVDGCMLRDIAHFRKQGVQLSASEGVGFQRTQWDQNRFHQEISELIEAKSKNYVGQGKFVDILFVCTDEPWFEPAHVHAYLARRPSWKHQNIGSGYLLMCSGVQVNGHWPVLKLF